ncbi:uncharacterized protein LOC120768795 [Bactrocera tryoni]|uniref:uncharacterized protein LOC120768795 n=1 Tax=Bactrocera tryoni TaxID=59916 RepID=UPI001A976F93|nr:uncharacterized protein LOC120768795 [Bactrocera tryoni]
MSSTQKELTDGSRIASFVVLDLETNDLPYHFSKIAITELCMYGFSTSELETAPLKFEEIDNVTFELERPRHLHKLTMLFNPRRLIHPKAEEITGLSNYSLEKESHFDENAAGIITNFLKHMPQPVCLVAHNGDTFDFPIVKQTFQKLNLSLPCETLCVDSLLAFRVLDQQLQFVSSPTDTTESSICCNDKEQSVITSNSDDVKETLVDSRATLLEQLDADTKIDWRARNETTPRRPIVTGVKRSHSAISKSLNSSFKSKRSLFANVKLEKYPPKGVYKLENMYKRFFKKTPKNVHCAEADVETLMHLMRVYGSSFLTYAEEKAVLFEDIPLLPGIMEESFQCNYEQRTIASFVLLKFDTNEEIRFHKIDAIDEFCMYGISNNQLETKPIYNKHCCAKKLMIPKKPRVLNKLLLTINSEQNTERSDYLSFIHFIKHLQQPVCLVANRGKDLCFPIIKHKLDKFKLEMPPNTLCLDSTFAFRGLDEQMTVEPAKVKIFNQTMFEVCVEPVENEINADTRSSNNNITNADNRQDTQLLMTIPTRAEQLDAETKTDWRAHNETTPQRPIVTGVKRRISNDSTPTTSEAARQKVSRRLFTNELEVNKYDLTNMYERFFNTSYRRKPYTESHVEALMRLIQVYGESFTEYAKNYATPFAEIQQICL